MHKINLLLEKSRKSVKSYIAIYQAHRNYSKILQWVKLISITGAAQVLVQAVGFLSGILIIRLLPIEEYAFYTLANTMLGTMTLLADGGISAGVLSQGGKVWEDKNKLGAVLATGLDLRKKFAVGSLIVSVPILIYLLIHHDASWFFAVLISLSLIPAFYADLSGSLLVIVPKLHQDIRPIQRNDVGVSVGRLLLTGTFILIFPFTFVALLAGGLPRIYGNIQLKKIAHPFVKVQPPDPGIRARILATVKRMMPGVIYYCLSGQITLWLLSVLGDTDELAQLGALAKLVVVLSVISTLIGTLIVPRFARLIHGKTKLLQNYILVNGAVTVVMFCVIGIVYLFPDQILWVLGNSYRTLQTELVLTMIGGCIALIAGTSYALNVSRDWVMNPVLSITISLISIAAGIVIFNVSELRGVLIFNIFLAFIQLLMNGAYGLFRIQKEPDFYPV